MRRPIARGRRRGRLLAALGAAALLSGAARAEAPESGRAEGALDARGFLTCGAFLRMSPAARSAYLIGLREGWQTAAGSVELHAAGLELNETLRAALQDTAGWMRSRIDHAGVSYGAMLARTGIVCEREPGATAWRAWLDAIRASGERPEDPAP